jgi:hypothetical protein
MEFWSIAKSRYSHCYAFDKNAHYLRDSSSGFFPSTGKIKMGVWSKIKITPSFILPRQGERNWVDN